MKVCTAMIGLGLLVAPGTAGAQLVATEGGRVAGQTANGVVSWKGIPFAAPPVGELRWRAPQPVQPWTGIRQANAYGQDCMQVPFPNDAAPLGTTPAEDCLTLNVWRPIKTTRPLPVVVWVYGGGFVNGGASAPIYTGARLAAKGVVFVSFNYRVGRFGTFAHPQLTKQNADGGLLGNYGYMDQLAALRWVQRNIRNFGGDPANVTLIGESAGGISVNALLSSPLAKGLFSRAVIMSGGDGEAMGSGGLTDAEDVGVAFAASKGIAADEPDALAKLRALPAEAVTDGLNLAALFTPGKGRRTFFSPFVDGRIAVDAAAAFRDGTFAKVPVMIGATDNDIGGPTGYMVSGARRVAGWIADAGAPVYQYRFAYTADAAGRDGADHASDVPYFLDTVDIKLGAKTTARDRAMAHTISAYVINFATSGDPNAAGLPQWPRYDRQADRLMTFTTQARAVAGKDPLGPVLDAHVPANPLKGS